MTAAPPRPDTVQATATLVRIAGLEVGYARHGTVTPAVTGLDLTVRSGEVVAIVGESGSGKTTTANAVLGLLPDNGRITAGSIVVDGVETVGARERTLRALRGSTVALVPQDPLTGLNPTRRVGAHVADAVRLRGVRGAQVHSEVVDLLEQAGIPDAAVRARQYPHELSGGLRQRVLIAIALAGHPQLIIADEPTSALDVTVQKRILDHLGALVRERGISLLIITHDLAVATHRADRVVVMQGGRIVEQGPPGEVLDHPAEGYTRSLIAAAPGLRHDGRIVAEAPAPAPGDRDAVLELHDLVKTFPVRHARRGERGFHAVRGVSLAVPRGGTHALVGESGSGKTTTLRMALGLETPTSGSIRLDGEELGGLGWRALRAHRRRMQFVQQDPFAALDPRFTVHQAVVEPLVCFGIGNRRTRRERARALLDQVALAPAFLDRRPAELSGGQRQRVAIARALALEPSLLLLDEPVSALDVSVQQQILELLARLQGELGLSYLMVCHDLAVVAQTAHTVTVLREGVVVEDGPVAEVFANPQSPYTRALLDAIPGRRGAAGRGTP